MAEPVQKFSDFEIFRQGRQISAEGKILPEAYTSLYKRSVEDPVSFWFEAGQRLNWFKPYSRAKVKQTSFQKPVSIKWYEDGELNACYNCVDRHLPAKSGQTAIIWEGDEPGHVRHITYDGLLNEVSQLANAMKAKGVRKGDRVTIYMPMIPEATYAMLACARIGAIHSVVFGGFSPESLRDRILDCGSKVVITADEGLRGGKKVPLKANTDEALTGCPEVETVLVYRRTGGEIAWTQGRDVWWHEIVPRQSTECPCESMEAEAPLFILYTSGSTGKPKGVLHTTGGYMVYSSLTHKYVFDYRPGEVFWCTADVGWITGHSYIVYGPLANGATILMYEGVPQYPDWSRFWQIVDRHRVNIFYTAPTAIRSMISAGNEWVHKTSRSTLRILGTVGEPINREAWLWYFHEVGNNNCPVIDTWWQTETGGHMIAPLPAATPLKPGSATRPFFGVQPAIVDPDGKELEGTCEGNLCINDSWPGQMRTVFGDHDRFEKTYFSTFPGQYFTGDGCRRDEDGYYWITGRVDDVLNVSGHRMGTAEIESAIDEHAKIAEAAVVGYPHDIKGQGIYAYVTPMDGVDPSEADDIRAEVVRLVRKIIGPIATPDVIHWAPGLPKTRSGKIMRRILRKIAAQEFDTLGDTSTLADPSVVDALIEERKRMSNL